MNTILRMVAIAAVALTIGPTAVMAQTSTEVVITGPLPRATAGAVDTAKITQIVSDRFAQGATQVQFVDTALANDEARKLFTNTDPTKNLLRQVGQAIPVGVAGDRSVTFSGAADVQVRVQREDGQLRARLDGLNLSGLTAQERAQLLQDLRTKVGFDQVRLEGGDRMARGEGNRGRGGNSGHGSLNSGPGRGGDMNGRGGQDEARMTSDDRRADRGVASVDRPQRPERPERPQRPERPERSGRN